MYVYVFVERYQSPEAIEALKSGQVATIGGYRDSREFIVEHLTALGDDWRKFDMALRLVDVAAGVEPSLAPGVIELCPQLASRGLLDDGPICDGLGSLKGSFGVKGAVKSALARKYTTKRPAPYTIPKQAKRRSPPPPGAEENATPPPTPIPPRPAATPSRAASMPTP